MRESRITARRQRTEAIIKERQTVMSELINKEIESILALTLSSLREHERGQTRHRPEVYTHGVYSAQNCCAWTFI